MTTAIEAGKAFVSLGVKSTLDKDLRKSKHTLKKFAKASAKLFAGVAAAGFAVAAASLKKLVDKSNELSKLAGEINVTTQELQKLEYVGRKVGLELDDMIGGIEEMQLRLAEASAYGTGPAVEMLDKLGISLSDLEGLSVEKKIGVIADELNKLEGASKQFAADELFGGDGRRLMNVFALGAEGIAKMSQEAVDLGLVLSDDTKKSLKAVSDAGLDLELAWQGFIGSMASTYGEEMEMMVAATRVALSDMSSLWNAYAVKTGSQLLDVVAGFNDIVTFGLWDNSYADKKREEADKLLDDLGASIGEEMIKQKERRKARAQGEEKLTPAQEGEQRKREEEQRKREEERRKKEAESAHKGTGVPSYLDLMAGQNNTFSSMIPDGVAPDPGSISSAVSSVGSFVGGAGVGQAPSKVVEVGEKQLDEQKKTNHILDEMKSMANMQNGGTFFQGGN